MGKIHTSRHMRIGIDFESTLAKIDQPLLDKLREK